MYLFQKGEGLSLRGYHSDSCVLPDHPEDPQELPQGHREDQDQGGARSTSSLSVVAAAFSKNHRLQTPQGVHRQCYYHCHSSLTYNA